MLRLGSKVVIVADSFEQNLPIGEYGYIIANDRNADNVFDHVVRVPKLNKNVYVPAKDLELEEVLLRQEADRIEREALSTRNEFLFHRIMCGDLEEVAQEPVKEVQSREDFIKQVNLRAWI